MAVKRAADLFAIFKDGGLGAYLYATILNYFDAVNYGYFLKHDNSLSCPRIHLGFGLTIKFPTYLNLFYYIVSF